MHILVSGLELARTFLFVSDPVRVDRYRAGFYPAAGLAFYFSLSHGSSLTADHAFPR